MLKFELETTYKQILSTVNTSDNINNCLNYSYSITPHQPALEPVRPNGNKQCLAGRPHLVLAMTICSTLTRTCPTSWTNEQMNEWISLLTPRMHVTVKVLKNGCKNYEYSSLCQLLLSAVTSFALLFANLTIITNKSLTTACFLFMLL